MRHQVSNTRLTRPKKESKAIARSLVRTLILNGQVKTTDRRASLLKRIIDPLVIKAKRGTLADRRQVLKFITDKDAGQKLFKDASRFAQLTSGFVRIVKMGKRIGDGAMMAMVEWTNKTQQDGKKPKFEARDSKQILDKILDKPCTVR